MSNIFPERNEITILVHGPIMPETKTVLDNIRKIFENCPIILSTWKNSDLTNLSYDILVESDDPGAEYFNIPKDKINQKNSEGLVEFELNGKKYCNLPKKNNVNRMIVSVQEGLKEVKTKYVLKLRSDLILKSDKFLEYWDKYSCYNNKYKIFKHRIINDSTFAQFAHVMKKGIQLLPFHMSDWLHFGLTEDVKQELCDIDKLIEDTQILLANCKIDFLNVLGGEPFCHPQLDKLLEFIARRPDIKGGRIITNGTILPNEKQSKILTSQEMRSKEYPVCLDIYEPREAQALKFKQYLIDNNIKHFINWNNGKSTGWLNVGGPEQKILSDEYVNLIYKDCPVRFCGSFLNGELTSCPRGVTTEEVYGHKKFFFEHVNVSKLKKNAFSRALIALCMNDKISKEFCKYCLGFDSNINHNLVKVGEQIE